MESSKPAPFLAYLPTALILSAAGWGGLAVVLYQTLPTLGPRWLFFFLAVLALSGTSLPVVYFLNRRFPSTPPAEAAVLLRQSTWVGIYGGALAWLQLGRMLTPLAAGVLAGLLVLVETLVRMRERSRWRPKA